MEGDAQSREVVEMLQQPALLEMGASAWLLEVYSPLLLLLTLLKPLPKTSHKGAEKSPWACV